MDLSCEELNRYSRHLMLREVGINGQRTLKSAKVLIVGVGGLGSPISLYLAAAGIGHIGIVDSDTVDISNLQRQILYNYDETGKNKVHIAKKRLLNLNPTTVVEPFNRRLTAINARQLVAQFDIIVDGSDNFPTRYVINDACVLEKKPLVYGSIFRFEGQVSLFNAYGGPCYRCLFPSPPLEGSAPNCSEAGVLGVLPGIIGTIQATETIKWILQVGNSLMGRLLCFDALEMRFKELALAKNPRCPICSDNPSITNVGNHVMVCNDQPHAIKQLAPTEFLAWKKSSKPFFLLDVRDQQEYDTENLGGYLIPLSTLPSRMGELDKNLCIVVHCAAGTRSAKACRELSNAGFNNLWNLAGGITAIKKTETIRYYE